MDSNSRVQKNNQHTPSFLYTANILISPLLCMYEKARHRRVDMSQYHNQRNSISDQTRKPTTQCENSTRPLENQNFQILKFSNKITTAFHWKHQVLLKIVARKTAPSSKLHTGNGLFLRIYGYNKLSHYPLYSIEIAVVRTGFSCTMKNPTNNLYEMKINTETRSSCNPHDAQRTTRSGGICCTTQKLNFEQPHSTRKKLTIKTRNLKSTYNYPPYEKRIKCS